MPSFVQDVIADPVRLAVPLAVAAVALIALLLIARALPFARSRPLVLWTALWASCLGLLVWQFRGQEPLSLVALLLLAPLTWLVAQSWRMRHVW